MKIVYAVHHLPPHHVGGAENRALGTARWMQAHGQQVALICVEAIDREDQPYEDSAYEGLAVRRLSFDHRRLPEPRRWEYDNALVAERVADFLAEQRPDVFHLLGGYLMTAGAIRAAHAARVPIVITLTDFWFLCPRITLLRSDGGVCPGPPADPVECVRCLAEASRRYRWPARMAPGAAARLWRLLGATLPGARAAVAAQVERRRTLRAALDSAALVVSPSRFLRARYVEHGLAPERVIVMRQGVAVPPPAPARAPGRDRELVIGYLGQIKPHKGVDLLVEAALGLAARGRRFRLVIHGDQAEDQRYVAALRRRAGGAGWLEWRGVYRAAQVFDVLAGLDAVVLPSRWYENSPNVILEAQAAHVPVVASDLGGMAELVRHDVDGLLFRVGDARDLARQLARLLDEPSLHERLRASAPAVPDVDQHMAATLAVYRQVAHRPPPS